MRTLGRLRSVAVLAACAYAVHSLRYLLAYGSDANRELLAQGHGYLTAAPVVLTALLAAAAGQLVLRIARGGGARGTPASLNRLWSVAAAALLAIFVVQELAEGWLAAGHAAGLAAVIAHGGWLALPLSATGGLLVALLHRGAEAALAAVPSRAPAPRARPALTTLVSSRPRVGVTRVPDPWLGGRGPPALAG